MAVLIKIRRDTSGNWAAWNPVLAVGEPAYATDTKELAIGDGSTPFTSLQKFKTHVDVDLSGYATNVAVNGLENLLQAQVTNNANEIVNLQIKSNQAIDRFLLIENNLIGVDGQFGAINGRFVGVDASIANLDAEKNAIALRMGTAEFNITQLQGNVATLQAASIGEIDGGGAAG